MASLCMISLTARDDSWFALKLVHFEKFSVDKILTGSTKD